MKLIRAIIQPHRLEMVRDALKEKGITGMTAYQAQGFGRQRGHKEIYRGAEYELNFLPKIALDVVVEDEDSESVLDTIIKSARTGSIGDGKIFMMDVGRAVRIRTGELNEAAL
jgi:nitrogen regulatory protein P-II 1